MKQPIRYAVISLSPILLVKLIQCVYALISDL